MWSAEALEVNPSCDVTIHQIGPATSRAVIGSYPGSRAMITLDTTSLIRTLGKLWGEPLRPFHAEYHPVIFSAILNRDYQLTPWQRQPHIDQGITAMVYLNPEEMWSGGTGLYRHRPTGLSRVPIGMTAEFEKLAHQYGFSVQTIRTQDGYAEFINRVFFRQEFAAKENSYINDGNEYWELLYRIDMKPNRLVIFDGRMFHSRHIAQAQFRDYFRMNQILYLEGHDSGKR